MNAAMKTSKPDLRHHLSSEVLSRKENPMKVVQRLSMRNSNMISLANGDPHFSLYPIRKVQFEVAPVSSDEVEDPFMSWQNPNSPSVSFSSSRSDISSKSLSSESIPLNAALQYHGGTGSDVFVHAMEELTKYYHNPPNHKCLNTLGNMDGIVKCFRLLANPGDNILADEFAFGPPTNAALSQGINWVPIRIDKGGLIPSDLENVLSDWDEETKGRKPRILYTVPCGQNPTGCTLNLQRRKEIYAIACKYDLVIIEDDPYYFLQYSDSDGDAVPNLMPSFVSMDIEGRVIRVESCSKTIAPGMRLGWVVCSPMFYEHMLHLVESSTQFSHGFGQIFLSEMISGPQGWGVLGFDRWVQSLRKEYQRRRDHFQVIFDREVASTGYASAETPEAGMFLWIRIHLDKHPRFKLLPSRAADSKNGLIQGVPTTYGRKTNFLELMDEFFENCLNAGVVLTPSSVFALPYESSLFNTDDPLEDRINYVRATFAGPYETMEPGLKIVGQVLRDFFSSTNE